MKERKIMEIALKIRNIIFWIFTIMLGFSIVLNLALLENNDWSLFPTIIYEGEKYHLTQENFDIMQQNKYNEGVRDGQEQVIQQIKEMEKQTAQSDESDFLSSLFTLLIELFI